MISSVGLDFLGRLVVLAGLRSIDTALSNICEGGLAFGDMVS